MSQTSSITIRKATHDDADTIAEFAQAMAQETEGKQLDGQTLRCGVLRVLEMTELGFYLVAEVDGRVVGSLMINAEPSDWRDGVYWWFQSVYVLPEFRKVGVFGSLYKHVRQMAMDDGNVRGLRLYVENENRIAQRAYESLGLKAAPYRMYEQFFEPKS